MSAALARRLVLLLSLVLVLPALPSVAAVRLPDVVEPLLRTTPLAVGDTTTALAGDEHLVGVTWTSGAPSVAVRWRTPAGWTAWEAPEDDSDVPEPAERARAVAGTEPVWRPPGADLVQTRVSGAAQGLRLVRVADGTRRAGGWDVGLRLDTFTGRAHAAGSHQLGRVHTRAEWGADERLRRGAPAYASKVQAVVVHHTAGSNDYRPEDVPARIRADYAYHVQARGWGDLGYNLVVDRFGRIWEGRAGGLERATVGAHAAGFNTGSLGVSLLGDMTKAAPGPEVVQAMARVGAHAAVTWGMDPRGWTRFTSGGSPKFPKGASVALPTMHGHRDTGQTACPGVLYDRLDEIRARAAGLLTPTPEIVRVDLTGAPVHVPTPLVVRGALSMPAPWTASIRASDGRVLTHSAGHSDRAELIWDAMLSPAPGLPRVVPVPPGRYTWTVIVDDGVHPRDVEMAEFEVGLPLVR